MNIPQLYLQWWWEGKRGWIRWTQRILPPTYIYWFVRGHNWLPPLLEQMLMLFTQQKPFFAWGNKMVLGNFTKIDLKLSKEPHIHYQAVVFWEASGPKMLTVSTSSHPAPPKPWTFYSTLRRVLGRLVDHQLCGKGWGAGDWRWR